jgi:hypothetical protein
MSWVERHGEKCTTYNAAQSLDYEKKEVLTGCCSQEAPVNLKTTVSLVTNTSFVTRLWEMIKAVVSRNAGYFKRQLEYISQSMSA